MSRQHTLPIEQDPITCLIELDLGPITHNAVDYLKESGNNPGCFHQKKRGIGIGFGGHACMHVAMLWMRRSRDHVSPCALSLMSFARTT